MTSEPIFRNDEHGGDAIGILPDPEGFVIVYPDGFTLTIYDPVLAVDINLYLESLRRTVITPSSEEPNRNSTILILPREIRYAITHVKSPSARKALDAAASVRYHRAR